MKMDENRMNQDQPQNQQYSQGQQQNQNPQGGYNYQQPVNQLPKPFLPSYDVNTFAILALVMGIMGICTNAGLPGGILAIVFSEMAKKRVRPADELGKKFIKAGLVMGIIALVLFGLEFLGSFVGGFMGAISDWFYWPEYY